MFGKPHLVEDVEHEHTASGAAKDLQSTLVPLLPCGVLGLLWLNIPYLSAKVFDVAQGSQEEGIGVPWLAAAAEAEFLNCIPRLMFFWLFDNVHSFGVTAPRPSHPD